MVNNNPQNILKIKRGKNLRKKADITTKGKQLFIKLNYFAPSKSLCDSII